MFKGLSPFLPMVAAWFIATAASPVLALDDYPISPVKGSITMALWGGGHHQKGQWQPVVDGALFGGLTNRLTIFAPLAVNISLAPHPGKNGLAIAAGITDLFVTDRHDLLWAPAVHLCGRTDVAKGAAVNLCIGAMGVRQGTTVGSHWTIDGALALSIDLGPYLTFSPGIGFMRGLYSDAQFHDTKRAGFGARSAMVMGQTRATAFIEPPLFAIHLSGSFHLTISGKLLIDTHQGTTAKELLFGIHLSRWK